MPVTSQRTIALDVGDSRIGVAISDPLGISSQPLKTIERSGGMACHELETILADFSVSTVVVGMPNLLDGSRGEQAQKTEEFVNALKGHLQSRDLPSVEIVYVDERLTSVQAERHMQGKKLKNKARRAMIDQISAAILLDTYLLSANSNV